MSNCKICGRPLKESQWRENRNYKSCPKCSQDNGEVHVYYAFPEDFGTTEARVTLSNPEGAQSHCGICRNRANTRGEQKLCSDF